MILLTYTHYNFGKNLVKENGWLCYTKNSLITEFLIGKELSIIEITVFFLLPNKEE